MKLLVATLASLTATLLTSCDPVSITTLLYQPKNTPVTKLRKPLEATTRQFDLEASSHPPVNGQFLYVDERRGPGPKILVTLDSKESSISIMEMFVFSRTPRNKAFEITLRQEMASIGVSLTEAR